MAKKKPQRLKARLPRGLVDRDAAEIRALDRMLGEIRKVYERYGFEPVETPAIEYTDALGKFLPDQDRPNEGVFSFQDDDEQWLSLRYDLTAPLARYVAENYDRLPKPYRSYRAGYVYRNEKPGPGRFRQFMQFDADTVGAGSVAADAEMCMMMADTLEALGIARGDYVIRVNNRKVLDGVMEAIGVTEDGQKLAVLRAIDKLDKFGIDGVRLLLGPGRKDESGDFTKGAGLDEGQIVLLTPLLEYEEAGPVIPTARRYIETGEVTFAKELILPDSARTVDMEKQSEETKGLSLRDNLALGYLWALFHKATAIDSGKDGLSELEQIGQLVFSAGYQDRIKIDPSVVRGLEYYTGPVYEAELLFDVPNEKGEKVVFGSVGGGGRYDGLVGRFRGEQVPATGFSIGVSRLMTALKNLGKLEAEDQLGPVVVCVMDRDRLADYQRMVQDLRAADIPAEMFLGNPKQFGKQLQYADKRNSPCAVIQGSDEHAANQVQLKDLIEGKRLSAEIEDNEAWRESRPAQVTVSRDDLVAEVRKIVSRYTGSPAS